MKQKIVLTPCMVALYLVALISAAKAQDVIDASAADLDDFRTSFENPASISFLPDQLIFGTKAYEVGVNSSFFDISHGYLGYYSPYWRKRIGVFGEFLRAGIFNTTAIGVSYSERLDRVCAVGGRIDLVNQGFSKDRFQEVDPGDPVLSSGLSKNYLSVTAGIMVVPVPELSIGAAVKNINKPDVAMEEDNPFRLPVRYDIGLQYRAGRVHPSVNFGVEDGDLRIRLRLGVAVWDDLWARVDYQVDHMGFEGQMRVYRGLHFNYRFQYPLNELNTFSKGSHTISVVYDFTRILEMPALPLIRYTPEPVELDRSEDEIPVEGDFYILPSSNQLEIWEKNITRKADTEIPLEFIRRNYEKIFGELKNDSVREDLSSATLYPDTIDGLAGTYTPEYRSSLDSISNYLQETDSMETRIYAHDSDVFRAENLKDVIQNKSQIPDRRISLRKLGSPSQEIEAVEEKPTFIDTSVSLKSEIDMVPADENELSLLNTTETFIELSEESVRFDILSLSNDSYDRQWSLNIQNAEGNMVKEFTGVGNVPCRIEWNWNDENNELIKPGRYFFVLKWEDRNGRRQKTPMGTIHVKKYKKDIVIELTRKKKLNDKKVKRIELHLDQ